ncbi:MAG: hypothetical protein ABIE43_04590 [Patescibacteria group bacterium]
MYSTKQLFITILVTSLVFTSIGYIGASNFNLCNLTQGDTKTVPIGQNTYQAGWEAAKKRLAETGYATGMVNEMEIKSIHGQVKKVEGNKITLKIRPLEPLADPGLDTRIITVDNQTKITMQEQKDNEEYRKEMEDYSLKMQANNEAMMKTEPGQASAPPTDMPMPPTMYTTKTGSISDIKKDANITVIAANNIKNEKEFTATEINLISGSAMAAPITAAPAMPAPGAPELP